MEGQRCFDKAGRATLKNNRCKLQQIILTWELLYDTLYSHHHATKKE